MTSARRLARRNKRLDEIIRSVHDSYQTGYDHGLKGRGPLHTDNRSFTGAIRHDEKSLHTDDVTRWWWTTQCLQDLARQQGYQHGLAERHRLAQELFAQDATPLPADNDDTPPTIDTGDYERRD